MGRFWVKLFAVLHRSTSWNEIFELTMQVASEDKGVGKYITEIQAHLEKSAMVDFLENPDFKNKDQDLTDYDKKLLEAKVAKGLEEISEEFPEGFSEKNLKEALKTKLEAEIEDFKKKKNDFSNVEEPKLKKVTALKLFAIELMVPVIQKLQLLLFCS